MTAILLITDGTTEVDLLGVDGYILNSWRPAIAGYKGGGTFQSSSLSDGRRLVHKTFDAVVERMDLKALGVNQDTLITTTQELRRLLEKASDYWTTEWQDTPVYIVAKASKETNTRYAIIHTGVIPEDENPYSQPFLQAECESVMNNLALIVERGHWLDDVPGTGTCVEVSGTQDWDGITPLVFNGADQEIDCLSADSLDNLPDNGVAGKGPITVHGWIKTDGYGEGNQGRIAVKGSDDVDTRGWHFYVSSGFGLVARVSCDTLIAISRSGLDEFTADGEWLYVLMTYSETGAGLPVARRIYLNVGGTWVGSYTVQNLSIGNYNQDGGDNLIIGNNDGGTACFDGEIGWLEVAQSVIASPAAGDFTPPPRCIMPPPDTNSVFLGIEEGSGTTITDSSGEGNDGTAANDDWGDVCSYTFGRSETCLDEVYIANKHNAAQLTNIYHYDASTDTWSANLIDAVTPFAFLPDAPADTPDDAVYFGIDTSILDSGPFNNLVFDIDSPQTGITGIVWEIWTGAAWAAIATIQDNTDASGAMTGAAFDTAGVNSVHWAPVSTWAQIDLITAVVAGAPNITGYWVRARVDAAAGGATAPTQQSRDIYTITWPYVAIDADSPGGDIASIAKILLRNTSDADGPGGGAADFYDSRILCGLRSLSRGEDFSAYLNCSDAWAAGVGGQNPSGVTVAAGDGFNTNEIAVTGRRAVYNYAGAGAEAFADRVVFTLDETIASQYYGVFHAYVYAGPTTTAGDYSVRLRVQSSIGGQSFTLTAQSAQSTIAEVFDCGTVRIPPDAVSQSELIDQLEIAIQISHVDTLAETIYVYWLVLIPVDEWAIDTIDTANTAESTVERGRRLEIDSVSRPNKQCISVVRQSSDDLLVAIWRPITNGPAMLQANVAQRLWFLSLRTNEAGGAFWISSSVVAHSVRVEQSTRYFSMRGNR